MVVNTVKSISQGEYKERRSVFLAYLFPIEREEEINYFIKKIKEKHPDARHVCYAYRYKNKEFYSDAKEPAGSAGLPILNTLKKYHLFYVLGVVVRYFGGTKLGLSVLRKAYSIAMERAILHAEIVPYEPTNRVSCFVPYIQLGSMKHFLAQKQISILREDYSGNGVKLHLKVPVSRFQEFQEFIRGIENCFFTKLEADYDEID